MSRSSGSSVTVWVVRPTVHVDLGCCSRDERRHAASRSTPAGAARHLRSRAVLRHALAATTGVDASDVPLVAAPGTPPRVTGSAAPAVSLAHAAGTVAVAVTGSGPVGVDLEVAGNRRRPVPAPVLTAPRLAAVAELVTPELAPLAVWVLLEAALKAARTGFGLPQRAVGFTPVAGGVELDLPDMGRHGCAVRELAGGVLLGVATPGTAPTVVVTDPYEPHSSMVNVVWSPAS